MNSSYARSNGRGSGRVYFSASLVAVALAAGGSLLLSGLRDDGMGPYGRQAHYYTPEEEGPKFSAAPPGLEPFMVRGVEWLVDAQHESGGWGAGSSSNQQMRDPHKVVTDPGTTAFAAMALLRAGYNPLSGKHHEALRKALDHLLTMVENYKQEGPMISDVTGTQPQAKLGSYVDVSLCAQFFGRALPAVADDKTLAKRVGDALDKCISKIEASQKSDGSWNHGGWAPVLQSSMANNALEMAQVAGRKVDTSILQRSRDYQKGNYNAADGKVRSEAGAGVELYATSSGQRASADEAKRAQDLVWNAKKEGKLENDADISYETLVKAGASKKDADNWSRAYQQYRAAADKMEDERVLAGFGNNGGEEFLSYMLTSESMVMAGGSEWKKWNGKMQDRLQKIQNSDGSWSGHHCITSPVFCTAAVLLSLTADRDLQVIQAEHSAKSRGANVR